MRNKNQKVDLENPKHSVFTYKDIPVENHKTFLVTDEWKMLGP